MAIKFPSIPEPNPDPHSLMLTVRVMMQFLNLLTQNERGVPEHQYFERGSASETKTLRMELEALRSEFNAYKKLHP